MSQQPSGVDLARQALAAARAAAKTRPAQPERKKTRTTRTRGRTHGDPMGLGAAITAMMTERGWEPPAAGGSIIDQWPTIAPELAAKVHAARYEHDTGTLHLRPVSPAYATQLRLHQTQILAKVRQHPAGTAVRVLKILPAGAAPAPADTSTPTAPEPQRPVQPRKPVPPVYRAAREAALTHRPERPAADPYVLEAIQRQEAALRANRQPEPVTELDQTAPQVDRSEAVRRAAIARKRMEQTGTAEPRRAFDVA